MLSTVYPLCDSANKINLIINSYANYIPITGIVDYAGNVH